MATKRRQRLKSFQSIYSVPRNQFIAGGAPEIELDFDEYDAATEGLVPGTQFGNFVVLENFGGGEAAVLKVRRMSDDIVFALRVPENQTQESRHKAIADQMWTCEINDGSIARSHGPVILPRESFGILSEFIEGVDVCRYADQRSLTVADRLKLFRRFCSSVAQLHRRNLVHCDIKPSNALSRSSGRVCVLDLGGLAKVGVRKTRNHPGTVGYSAPERQADEWTVQTSTDTYSLGVVLHQLLVGIMPIAPNNNLVDALDENTEMLLDRCILRRRDASSLRQCIAKRLTGVVHRALDPDPSRRYRDADSLRVAVRQCLR